LQLGYLVGQYPAVNHTYILREVRVLRSLGFSVRVVSIRRPDRAISSLNAEEADESRQTFSVLGIGWRQALIVNIWEFARTPAKYTRTLMYAWSLTKGAPRLILPYCIYFFEAVVAGSYFRRLGVAFVHSHFSSTVTLLASRMFSIRFSLTIHGSAEFEDVVGFHMAEKVAGAQFVATISCYGASQVMKASDPTYWHKVRVLPLGVDPALFSPGNERSNRVPHAAFRLLFVGSLAPAKGLHILLAAVAALTRQSRKVELTFVGDGPERLRLEGMALQANIASKIIFCGAKSNEAVIDYYRRCDAFVLPSFAEGIPVVLMEAMAMEVPCVSTWITGIPELIDAGVNGLLVPPANAELLAAAIAKLMDDPALASKIGAAGRQTILRHFRLRSNTEALAQVFSEHGSGLHSKVVFA